jgi:hypothetical protein
MTAEIQACCYNVNGVKICEELEVCECVRGSASLNRPSGFPQGFGSHCLNYCRSDPSTNQSISGGCCLPTGCVAATSLADCISRGGNADFFFPGLACTTVNSQQLCNPTCKFCTENLSYDLNTVFGACCTYRPNNPNIHTSSGCTTVFGSKACTDQGGIFYPRVTCRDITCGPYFDPLSTQFPPINNYLVGCCELEYDDNGDPTGVSTCTDKNSQLCEGAFSIEHVNNGGIRGAKVTLCGQRNAANGLSACWHIGACCSQSGSCTDRFPYGYGGATDNCCNVNNASSTFLGIDTFCNGDGTCEKVEIPPENCFVAREDSYPDARRAWTIDVCTNVFFTSYRAPQELMKFITMTPTRIMDINQAARENEQEACAHHIGRPVIIDGLLKVKFCGRYEANQPVTEYDYIAEPMIMRKPDVNEIVEQGFMTFVSSYHTPRYMEVQYFSQHAYCGEQPI